MSNQTLVVVTSDIGADEIESTVSDRLRGDTEVKVLAPASGLSRIDWLTNAEDDARAAAAARADEVASALPLDALEPAVGDPDPLRAIADVLRTFRADEIVVVTKREDEASWLEHGIADSIEARFNIRVTHVAVGANSTDDPDPDRTGEPADRGR
jgi:hypothetical protein